MSEICEKCLKYEIALTRISDGRFDDGWPMTAQRMQQIATEALSTDQPLSDDERKMLQEYCDKMYSISPKP